MKLKQYGNYLKDANYERVDFETNADVYVINTCTVTNTGDKKVDKSLEEQYVVILMQ